MKKKKKEKEVLPNIGGLKDTEFGLDSPYMDRVEATGMGLQCSYTLPEFRQFFIETQARGLRRKGGFSVTLEVPFEGVTEALAEIEKAQKNAAAGGYPLEVEVIVAASNS